MPNSTQPTIYFSIDYRSFPSGMGQIIDTSQPKMIGDKYNMTLVDYGTNPQEDPTYTQTKYFHSDQARLVGSSVIKEIIQYLREQGVTHVQDGEMAYEYPGADKQGYFTLERWSDVYLNTQW